MIHGHWFRANDANSPCLYSACCRPQAEHVESCGEWMDPRHWHRPTLRHLARCARCGRPFAHSTHHGSRENRRLWHSDNLAARLAQKVRRR